MSEIITTPLNNEQIPHLKEIGVSTIILGDCFNAARDARPLNNEQFKEAINIAKACSLKVNIRMNRIYMEKELNEASAYLDELKQLDIDGIYYNDQAVYQLAKEKEMQSLLIYDPDTLMTNSSDINFFLNQGISAVVISKEITKEEIETIAHNCSNTQVVIHGYLPMSYSKRMLIDNYLDEIHDASPLKNRRDLTLIESTRQGKMPILEDNQGTAIFTDYIQASFSEVSDLVKAGVKGLIIDPIFQSEEAIDDAIKGYVSILGGEDGESILKAYQQKYPSLPLSTGYLYRKTNLVK